MAVEVEHLYDAFPDSLAFVGLFDWDALAVCGSHTVELVDHRLQFLDIVHDST
jgi:hypothetical protein